MEKSELIEVLECLRVQIENIQKSLDGIDNNLTEAFQAMDAIQYDFMELNKRIDEIK